ncbi:MAG: phage holin family protein [Solirubrobacteraceae bacterium]
MPDVPSKNGPVRYGEAVRWEPDAPRFSIVRFLLAWVVAAAAVAVAVWIVPGATIDRPGVAFVVAALIGVLNAVLPPILAALRLPLMLVTGFLLVLAADALVLMLAGQLLSADVHIGNFGDALLTSLVITAVTMTLQVLLGTNDDTEYTVRVTRRIARRQGAHDGTDVPGIVFLEIDGLALPVLRAAMRDGSAPHMARWIADEGYRLGEWETDLSSQTGASQAGILLGSNEDIPAFRWVEKENKRMLVCSSPADCAEIERRHSTGIGLLAHGGASRGNLLSGEADDVILTVSRTDAERKANPGYRAFLANGFNVTRALVLFLWEIGLELTAALRAKRRDVRPRGHRGGVYPLMRAAMCVIVRDLIVFGVLTDMMRGRPAIYATFSSYDEVAHHSGLMRADTLEALRKLDQQFGRLAEARRYAPRPYEIVVLSDHGQTQGATFKQRNGYGLDELVERSLSRAHVASFAGGDEQHAMVGHAVDEATGHKDKKRPKSDVTDREVVVLGSGNLGLVYLMDAPHRFTREEIDERHPELIPALRRHPHVGWVLVRSAEHGAVVLGPAGERRLERDRVEGEDPLAPFSPTAPGHLLRADGFAHVADLMVGSFYDPVLDEGCAFEELICFHGGLGGPQTQPFILHPPGLSLPAGPILGAAAVHAVLSGWRSTLQGDRAAVERPAAVAAGH